jgi:stage V sporulation protein S
MDTEVPNLMRVGAGSPPHQVAASIRVVICDENQMPTIRAVGAGAVNQACKAIAIARGYVAPRGIDLAVTIGFDTIIGDDGEEISSQIFRLFAR